MITTDPNDVTGKANVYQLTTLKSGFFYHKGIWIDMDGDGRKDYLTARSNAQAGQGELVWLHHPAGGLNTLPWAETVVTKGPDVMFDVIPGSSDSIIIFASEFFNHKLTVYEVSTKTGTLIRSRLIDDTLDQVYSVKYVNLSGKYQLLVNNHESTSSMAGVFLYDVPSDIFNGAYPKKTIANGFRNAFSLLIPNMCPGFPYAIKPHTSLPYHILIAGDGDYSAHLLRPDGQGGFKRELVNYLGGTVGSIATYDFDGDGYLEFFVPNYDNSYIEVYQFYDGPIVPGPSHLDNPVFLN